MGSTRINTPYVTTRSVTMAHSGSSLACKVTAPDVDGYTFVGWLGCSTQGNIGTPYMEDYSAKSTNVWDAAKTPSRRSSPTALYRLS